MCHRLFTKLNAALPAASECPPNKASSVPAAWEHLWCRKCRIVFCIIVSILIRRTNGPNIILVLCPSAKPINLLRSVARKQHLLWLSLKDFGDPSQSQVWGLPRDKVHLIRFHTLRDAAKTRIWAHENMEHIRCNECIQSEVCQSKRIVHCRSRSGSQCAFNAAYDAS